MKKKRYDEEELYRKMRYGGSRGMEKGKVRRKERYGGRRGMTKKSFLGSLGIAGWKKERYGGRRGMGLSLIHI